MNKHVAYAPRLCSHFTSTPRTTMLAGLLALFLLLPIATNALPVDRIAATVNDEVITASELAYTMALNRLLAAPGQEHTQRESEVLDGLITRRLLLQEARRLRFVDVSDQDLKGRIALLRQRFSSDAAFDAMLADLEISFAELARLLGEQLLIERFVEKKVGLFVRVGREEAQAYFTDHPSEFREGRFQDVQKAITAMLTQRKIENQLDQYVAEIRAKADIRIRPGDSKARD